MGPDQRQDVGRACARAVVCFLGRKHKRSRGIPARRRRRSAAQADCGTFAENVYNILRHAVRRGEQSERIGGYNHAKHPPNIRGREVSRAAARLPESERLTR